MRSPVLNEADHRIAWEYLMMRQCWSHICGSWCDKGFVCTTVHGGWIKLLDQKPSNAFDNPALQLPRTIKHLDMHRPNHEWFRIRYRQVQYQVQTHPFPGFPGSHFEKWSCWPQSILSGLSQQDCKQHCHNFHPSSPPRPKVLTISHFDGKKCPRCELWCP